MKQYIFLFSFAIILTFATVQSGPPTFEDDFELIVIDEGTKAWVLCNATNDSPLKYRWYDKQYDEEVSYESRADVSKLDAPDGSWLIFDPADKSHEGPYTCSAENQHGLKSKLYQIVVNSGNVTRNETVSVDYVDVLNVTDSSVEFLVRTSMPVEQYTMRYHEKINVTVHTRHFAKGETISLEGLIPSGLYTIQFQVTSREGTVSDWSIPLEVVLLPYTPEVVLRSLTGGTLQIEWSKLLDDFKRETIDGYSLSYGSMQRESYDTWKPITCFINIELPRSCYTSQYTIAALGKNVYYEIRLRARTKAGYGKPFVTKIYVA